MRTSGILEGHKEIMEGVCVRALGGDFAASEFLLNEVPGTDICAAVSSPSAPDAVYRACAKAWCIRSLRDPTLEGMRFALEAAEKARDEKSFLMFIDALARMISSRWSMDGVKPLFQRLMEHPSVVLRLQLYYFMIKARENVHSDFFTDMVAFAIDNAAAHPVALDVIIEAFQTSGWQTSERDPLAAASGPYRKLECLIGRPRMFENICSASPPEKVMEALAYMAGMKSLESKKDIRAHKAPYYEFAISLMDSRAPLGQNEVLFRQFCRFLFSLTLGYYTIKSVYDIRFWRSFHPFMIDCWSRGIFDAHLLIVLNNCFYYSCGASDECTINEFQIEIIQAAPFTIQCLMAAKLMQCGIRDVFSWGVFDPAVARAMMAGGASPRWEPSEECLFGDGLYYAVDALYHYLIPNGDAMLQDLIQRCSGNSNAVAQMIRFCRCSLTAQQFRFNIERNEFFDIISLVQKGRFTGLGDFVEKQVAAEGRLARAAMDAISRLPGDWTEEQSCVISNYLYYTTDNIIRSKRHRILASSEWEKKEEERQDSVFLTAAGISSMQELMDSCLRIVMRKVTPESVDFLMHCLDIKEAQSCPVVREFMSQYTRCGDAALARKMYTCAFKAVWRQDSVFPFQPEITKLSLTSFDQPSVLLFLAKLRGILEAAQDPIAYSMLFEQILKMVPVLQRISSEFAECERVVHSLLAVCRNICDNISIVRGCLASGNDGYAKKAGRLMFGGSSPNAIHVIHLARDIARSVRLTDTKTLRLVLEIACNCFGGRFINLRVFEFFGDTVLSDLQNIAFAALARMPEENFKCSRTISKFIFRFVRDQMEQFMAMPLHNRRSITDKIIQYTCHQDSDVSIRAAKTLRSISSFIATNRREALPWAELFEAHPNIPFDAISQLFKSLITLYRFKQNAHTNFIEAHTDALFAWTSLFPDASSRAMKCQSEQTTASKIADAISSAGADKYTTPPPYFVDEIRLIIQ